MSNRKIRRNKEKAEKKRLAKEIKQKMNMFEQLPDACLACEKEFNKKDREMVSSWYVVVREQENKVNLYCPTCWGTAQKVIKEYKDGQENSKSNV